MCEDGYGQVLEEYRELVESLFSLVLDHSDRKTIELTNLKVQVQENKQRREIEDMHRAMKDGKII